jgi:hypothetical protein
MEEKFDFKELEKGLITLSGKIDTIEQMERHKGEKFNIFSILNMERKEVETHSMFLYELLNPDGSHYQGTKYLEMFIKDVLELSDFDYKHVKVGRETFTDTSRRIDFTIENDKYYIAIEMKIDAGDQDEQLDDYFTFAKKQGKENTKVYYLSLDGKEANPKSVKNEETEYETISFQSDIIEFIEKSIEKSVSLPIVRETLIQYKTLIKKITNQTTQEITMQVEKMINTPEMAKSATMMAQNLGHVWALREVKFWRDLTDKLEEYLTNKKGWMITYDDVFCDKQDNLIESNDEIANILAKYRKKNYCCGVTIQKDDFELYLYSWTNDNLNFQIEKSKNIDNIANICNITKKFEDDKRWTTSKYQVNFSKDYINPTYDIFDDKKLEEIVKNVAKEVESYMDKIIQVIK